MNASRTRLGFQMNLGRAMLAIALFALILAPLGAPARSPSREGFVTALLFEIYLIPISSSLALKFIARPSRYPGGTGPRRLP